VKRSLARRRLAAFAWDYLVIAAYALVLSAISSLIWSRLSGRIPGGEGNPWLYDLLAFTTLVLPVILYFAFSEASRAQATWGKRRTGLRVVSLEGTRLTISRSLLRSALKFLPWQIAHTSLFHIPGWPMAPETVPASATAGFIVSFALVAVYLVTLARADGRTAYDRAAGSRVAVAQPDPR
jgi:uncharacterized RDD family membrane protein YckC